LSHPSEKYEFVSWDDYSQYTENKNVPNHQPELGVPSSHPHPIHIPSSVGGANDPGVFGCHNSASAETCNVGDQKLTLVPWLVNPPRIGV